AEQAVEEALAEVEVVHAPELHGLDALREDADLVVDGAIGDAVAARLAAEVQDQHPHEADEREREDPGEQVRPEPGLPARVALVDENGGEVRAVARRHPAGGDARERRRAVEHAAAEAALHRGVLDLLRTEGARLHGATLPRAPRGPHRRTAPRAA